MEGCCAARMVLFNIVVRVSDQLAHCLSPAWFLCQAEGFHGELEEFLLWLRRTESQLSAAKPTGGLPETAREQLQQHMVHKMSSPLVHSLDIKPLSNKLLLEHLFYLVMSLYFYFSSLEITRNGIKRRT